MNSIAADTLLTPGYFSAADADGALSRLISEAWELYANADGTACVVNPSAPILFFGDLYRYRTSPCKIITVGLNPSRIEFPNPNRFTRFKAAEEIYPAITQGNEPYAAYVDSLCNYFIDDPYRAWFGSLEPILQGAASSYYPGQSNRALHTDLCSPLATDPTWSRLPAASRNILKESGVNLWHRLIGYLEPDVVLISVAAAHLASIRFDHQEWAPFHMVAKKAKPYIVKAAQLTISGEKRASMYFGQAAQTPFGFLSTGEKQELGARIAEEYARGR